MIYATQMAVLLNLSTEKIINNKLAKVNKKYPAKLVKKKAKKDSGSGEDSEYWKIKKAYREKG